MKAAQQLLTEFQATAQAAGCELHQFAKAGDYPLVGAQLGDGGGCIAFLAGLHGDEPGGMHGIVEYLRGMPKPPCKIILAPVMNPVGLDRGTRNDGESADINRQFCDEPEGVYALMTDYLEYHKVRFLATLHEDSTTDGFYLYYSNHNDRSFYESIVNKARKYFPVLKDKTVHGDRVDGGLVLPNSADLSPKHRCSLENYAHTRLGCQYLTTEPPGGAPLRLRAKFLAEVVGMVIQHEST